MGSQLLQRLGIEKGKRSNSAVPMEGERSETPRTRWCPECHCYRVRHSQSMWGLQEDVPDISPRLTYHNPTINLQRRLHKQSSLDIQDTLTGRTSTASTTSTETSTLKSVADLIHEVATLELEVLHLERHLLSLYRTAFGQYLASFPSGADHSTSSRVECLSGGTVQYGNVQNSETHIQVRKSDQLVDETQTSSSLKRIQGNTFDSKHIQTSPAFDTAALLYCKKSEETSKSASGRRSLADLLGASMTDHLSDSSCKLSEDIIKCISAVYCKLAKPLTEDVEPLASPTPSVSSSSTFSPKDPYDNWSPRCHYEVTTSPSQLESPEDTNSPYSGMVLVPQICLDANRFGYASKRLETFRSLIQRLEKIDPRKMKHDEQVSFWINIHNALVMHAFLAYGLHDNHMKRTFMVLKAAYNVGGHSINAHVIQNSILGCQHHRPSLWMMHAFFSPTKKFIARNDGHPYALHHPVPLAHFALCTGSSSDPAVRLYTAKGINEELEMAKTAFIQANAIVHKQSKVILPKLLYYYAKDTSLELCDAVEVVAKCMPDSQQKAIQRLRISRRIDKCVEWLPYKSSFGYIVHRDLAE